ncbi:MAG: hypothetical protein HY040_01410 [Planctomycetes bacterium]|nr:hypothetical protein [Planctomycetota bacterium]
MLKTRQLDELRHFDAALGIQFTEEKHGNGPVHYVANLGDLVLELTR